jgi:dihydroorotate dehydrogenase (NAD+) catalytic subunit
VIGIGGIMTGEDALEFLVAGATACQVGTASFVDPAACRKIITEMERYLRRHRIATAAELCGTLRLERPEQPQALAAPSLPSPVSSFTTEE